MYTKRDFQDKIRDSLNQYPETAQLHQAGAPRILQPLDAMATMLAMLSQQYEIAAMEPFEKVRDATIYADAALKGIVPVGIPQRVRISISNPTASPFTVAAARTLLDANGYPYRVDTPVTVAAGGSSTFEAVQIVEREVTHTVAFGYPFYRVEVPAPEDGLYIAGFTVASSIAGDLTYHPQFTNVGAGDPVYHVETDEYRRLYVVLGIATAGYEPAAGEVFTLTIRDTVGDARPAANSPFIFEYTASPADNFVTMTMNALLVPGAAPPDIATLREFAKYPSVYDDNAVYLGEFDFLIRRHLTNLSFLSVWNEQIEELVRGPDVDNINKLFISCLPAEGGDLSATQANIRAIVERADDSYRLAFVSAAPIELPVTITAQVARIHDPGAVESQIKTALLGQYGATAAAAKRGMMRPQVKAIFKLLRENVPALADDGSDFTVNLPAIPGDQLPEQFRYMTGDSISVTVTVSNYNDGRFGN
jgi:hypothetical protein